VNGLPSFAGFLHSRLSKIPPRSTSSQILADFDSGKFEGKTGREIEKRN
jgi:hypothetical protein